MIVILSSPGVRRDGSWMRCVLWLTEAVCDSERSGTASPDPE